MSSSGQSPAYLPEQLQLPQLLVVVLRVLPIVLQDKLEGEEKGERLALSDTQSPLPCPRQSYTQQLSREAREKPPQQVWQREGASAGLGPCISRFGTYLPSQKPPNLARLLLNLSLMQSQGTGSCGDNVRRWH